MEAGAPSAWGTQMGMAVSIPLPGSHVTAQGQRDRCACAFQSPKAQKHRQVRDETQYFTAQRRQNGMKRASSPKSILEKKINEAGPCQRGLRLMSIQSKSPWPGPSLSPSPSAPDLTLTSWPAAVPH